MSNANPLDKPIGIEISDIKGGKKCWCGGTVLVNYKSVKKRDGDIVSWEGICKVCTQVYTVFND